MTFQTIQPETWTKEDSVALKSVYDEVQMLSKRTIQKEVLIHYGGRCACCGFNDLDKMLYGKSFLQIDHINGREESRKIHSLSLWLKSHNFPEGYRVLCRGCNNAMEYGHEKCILHEVRG